MLSTGGVKSDFEAMKIYIYDHFINCNSYKKVKYRWGVFNVSGERISFERWYPSEKPHKAFVRSGIILNDSTFVIKKSIHSATGVEKLVNETYYFREFTHKPDSTNSFIE